MKGLSRLLCALLVVPFVLAACGASGSTPVGQDPSKLPLDFEVELYQGQQALGAETVKLSAILQSGKPVVLNFWAGLCPPCRVEMPDFEQVHRERGGEIVMLGLDIGPFVYLGTRETGKALLKELELTYPAGTTYDTRVVGSYKIIGMPTTLFIKPDGEVFDRWTGLLTKDKLEELVSSLAAASKAA